MITATIVKKRDQKGNIIIIDDPKDSQILIEALTEYCNNNKRKRRAKTLLKTLETDLECW